MLCLCASLTLTHLSFLSIQSWLCRVGRAAEKLEDAAFELIRVATVVEATSQPMPKRDPLRPYMDKIYQQVCSLAIGLQL